MMIALQLAAIWFWKIQTWILASSSNYLRSWSKERKCHDCWLDSIWDSMMPRHCWFFSAAFGGRRVEFPSRFPPPPLLEPQISHFPLSIKHEMTKRLQEFPPIFRLPPFPPPPSPLPPLDPPDPLKNQQCAKGLRWFCYDVNASSQADSLRFVSL